MTQIDRITPTLRPTGRPSGYQKWRDLLFLHWEVDSAMVQSFLPDGLTVDCFNGKAFVGVVPFSMQDVRPWNWVPSQLAFRFLECNVRTYVHRDGRPGVYFFSLDAASRLAVWAARTFWGLPYFNATMALARTRMSTDTATQRSDGTSRSDDFSEIRYEMQRNRSNHRHAVHYQIGREIGPSHPDTIEHFLLERYLLFVARGSELQVGQVHHTPYPVFEVNNLTCQDELAAAAGFPGLASMPELAHYSPGVDVEIFSLSPA